MFTGIIEGLGTLTATRSTGSGCRLSILAGFSLEETKRGDSIAVNGACLTAVKIGGRRFEADVSPETIEKTTFSIASVGDRLNLERALRISDRLDGHLVSGHIDGAGEIHEIYKQQNMIRIAIDVPGALSRYIIQKGSVAVDGISLTVNRCRDNRFEVNIIPHTAKSTTLGFKKAGDAVNIETDMIGKYVERFMAYRNSKKTVTEGKDASIDKDFLAKSGFI